MKNFLEVKAANGMRKLINVRSICSISEVRNGGCGKSFITYIEECPKSIYVEDDIDTLKQHLEEDL